VLLDFADRGCFVLVTPLTVVAPLAFASSVIAVAELLP
jgi:hypothetical protein